MVNSDLFVIKNTIRYFLPKTTSTLCRVSNSPSQLTEIANFLDYITPKSRQQFGNVTVHRILNTLKLAH